MNVKILFKAIFLLIVLLLLVLMGMNNSETVNFKLPPLVTRVTQKSAIMYYAFFAVGFLTGTIIMAGGGKKGSSSGGKSAKSDR